MKVLVTGGGGLLATAIRDEFIAHGDSTYTLYKDNELLLSVKSQDAGLEAAVLGDPVIEKSRSFERVLAWAKRVAPDWIIHAAAWTDVDGCETERLQAVKWNALSCRDMAVVATQVNAPLMLISTDYVFSGQSRQPYSEDDDPSPSTVYGLTKWLGEELARAALPEQLVVLRTAWLFGPDGRNFVDTIFGRLREGDEASVVDDQRGCPTFTRDLSKAIRLLIAKNLRGTFHVAGSGDCTWFELAKAIEKFLGLEGRVTPTSTPRLNRPAPRPEYSVLNCRKFADSTGWSMPHWRESLARYLSDKEPR